MNIPTPIKLKGVPGSPYTRKMLALLRYRHIAYELLIGDQAVYASLPAAKVNLLPTFFLPNKSGEIEAVVDSTPIIRRFEKAFTNRSVIPSDPVIAFLNYLLEDYGDEWLTKAMFHYRWRYKADIDMAAKILPRWRGLNSSDEKLEGLSNVFSERQISRLYVVGSNDTTAPVIEESYHRFLKLMNDIIQKQTFVMGVRPGSADFAIYAQLTQLTRFDPTPSAICLKEAPRVTAWTDIVDDLSGTPATENGFIQRKDARRILGDLLAEVGRVYVPALRANGKAIVNGDAEMRTKIDGRDWIQPTFPYQGKCLRWIREQYSALNTQDQASLDKILADTGCEVLFEEL